MADGLYTPAPNWALISYSYKRLDAIKQYNEEMNTVTIYNAINQLLVTLEDQDQLGDRSYESGAFGFDLHTSD